eukprot:gene7520-31563_t
MRADSRRRSRLPFRTETSRSRCKLSMPINGDVGVASRQRRSDQAGGCTGEQKKIDNLSTEVKRIFRFRCWSPWAIFSPRCTLNDQMNTDSNQPFRQSDDAEAIDPGHLCYSQCDFEPGVERYRQQYRTKVRHKTKKDNQHKYYLPSRNLDMQNRSLHGELHLLGLVCWWSLPPDCIL